jgi:type II secretory pathway component PulK
MMQPTMEFLTTEEAIKVDAALLSSKDKFSTRLAIYALRCLKQIAEVQEISVEQITPAQITDWIKQDQNIQQQLEVDSSFESFFTRLVLSSLKPLTQIAQSEEIPIEMLTVEQVIAGFEKQNKI